MKTKNILFILVASTFLYSCEDFFNSVTDVDIAAHESKLVVFGYMDRDLPIQSVSVSNSKGYTESGNPDIITDATVALSRNGNLLGDFIPSGSGEYYLDAALAVETGDELRLDVSVDGYEPVYAVETVPPPINIESVTYKGESLSQEYAEILPEYEILINDDGNVENYYAIEVWEWDTINDYRSHVYIYSNDLNIEYWGYENLMMNDNAFNGNTYRARIHLEAYDDLPENIVYEFRILSMSENMYRYAKSYTNYMFNDGNPFAEPVTVTTNMQEEGFGLFTYLRTEKIILE